MVAYHEEQLGEPVHYVEAALERFRSGELDAFDLDEVIFQYSRAARQLWKFMGNVEFAARMIVHVPTRRAAASGNVERVAEDDGARHLWGRALRHLRAST